VPWLVHFSGWQSPPEQEPEWMKRMFEKMERADKETKKSVGHKGGLK
jgi:hypothetical protein